MCRFFDGTLLDKSRSSGKPSLINDSSVDTCVGMLEVQAATVPPQEARSKLRERMVQDVATLTRGAGGIRKWPLAEAWSCHKQNDVIFCSNAGASGGGAAGLMDSGGHCVALPCASAKCSRLLPEVFDDCSQVGRRPPPRDGAIIRELERDRFCHEFPGDWRYLSF